MAQADEGASNSRQEIGFTSCWDLTSWRHSIRRLMRSWVQGFMDLMQPNMEKWFTNRPPFHYYNPPWFPSLTTHEDSKVDHPKQEVPSSLTENMELKVQTEEVKKVKKLKNGTLEHEISHPTEGFAFWERTWPLECQAPYCLLYRLFSVLNTKLQMFAICSLTVTVLIFCSEFFLSNLNRRNSQYYSV